MDRKEGYTNALRDYLNGAGENALEEAYMLGRRALEQGTSAMDMAIIHHEALSTLLQNAGTSLDMDQTKLRMAQAGKFLAECLSPFEMAQRGFQETIAALKTLNEHLEDEVRLRTQALSESEERYRTLIQISPDGITVTDLKGQITLSNQQAALLHGYLDPGEEIGIDAATFVAQEDMDQVRSMAERVLETGSIQSMEYALQRKDGSRVNVEARVTLMLDAGRKPQGFVGVIRDITQRKEAERKLWIKTLQQEAVAALGQLALADIGLAQLMHDLVMLVTQTLDVEFCELLEVTGDGEDLVLRDGIGWRDGSIGTTTVSARGKSHAGFTLLSANPVIVTDLAAETRFTPSSLLLEHHVVSGITVIIHSDSQPYGVLGAHTIHRRDFTTDETHFLQSMANTLAMAIKNRRLLESEARRRETAERANDERLRMLAVVNHELRTPLASIKGFASTLLADDVVWSPENQLDFIQTINDEADKLSNLIEQLLELTKIEAGRVVITPVQQPLSDIFGPIMAQLKTLTRHHNLVSDVPESLPPVLVNSQRSGQVLVNLVENATKYAPESTQITISACVEGDFMRISVADQGAGFAPGDVQKVFLPFYRSDDPGAPKSKGAGLGLYICQKLVEAQGGRIWIQEHEGPGAIVTFTLPLATPF